VSDAPDRLVRSARHDAGEQAGAIVLLTLNRPAQLNALSDELMTDLVDELDRAAADERARVVVITGAGRAFAAGADVHALAGSSAVDTLLSPRIGRWDRVRGFSKPLVAAVGGLCLGGGCELALACDVIVAAHDARFGQPETALGIPPGAGGTQWTARLLGKSLAMEMVLAGRQLDAAEALAHGLCSRVVAREVLIDEALAVAAEIARRPPVAIRLAREAVLQAYETALSTGLAFERRSFALAFASRDAHEGMQAFVERREPRYEGR
jgi:enoyl-CoA hydratase